VLLGPTGVGKTDLAIDVAHHLGCSILSCDSRQIFREMTIGTAVPSAKQLSKVRHYFIQSHSIFDYFSAGRYEIEALELLKSLFVENPIQLMVGGSMLYIDAVCKGLDDIPHPSSEILEQVERWYSEGGLHALTERLKTLDPDYCDHADMQNRQRVAHALAVTLHAKKPYSSLLTKRSEAKNVSRPFKIVKIGLTLQRELLYERINRRVDMMMKEGLEQEARSLYSYKKENALNTVGYRELFSYFDGEITLEQAIALVKRNSRRYAKRQMTWFNADPTIRWYEPTQKKEIIDFVSTLKF